MFKYVIQGGLKGLILASASALMFSSVSWADEHEEDDDGEANPQGEVGALLHEEGGALDALHEAEGGEDKSAAAQAIGPIASAHANGGQRPETAGRPDFADRPTFAGRPDVRPPVDRGRPDGVGRPN